jgi:hypothetical protein
MKHAKLIKHLEHCIDYEENWKGTYEDQVGQWFDKWDQGDCEAQGHSTGYSEGYCKAMDEVIALLKKEKEVSNEV